MGGRTIILTVWAGLLVLPACKKDPAPPTAPHPDGPASLHPFLQLTIDSACLALPNVVTPNADGINDVIVPGTRNITHVDVQIHDAGDHLLFSGDLQALAQYVPPGPTSAQPPLPLTVSVDATTSSGQQLQGSAVVYSITDLQAHCFTSAVQPVTGDRFYMYWDPEVIFYCDTVGISAEDHFCLQ